MSHSPIDRPPTPAALRAKYGENAVVQDEEDILSQIKPGSEVLVYQPRVGVVGGGYLAKTTVRGWAAFEAYRESNEGVMYTIQELKDAGIGALPTRATLSYRLAPFRARPCKDCDARPRPTSPPSARNLSASGRLWRSPCGGPARVRRSGAQELARPLPAKRVQRGLLRGGPYREIHLMRR